MNPVAMLLLRHFWILGIVVPCINAAIYALRARQIVRKSPESEPILTKIILFTLVWCGLPFVVAGVGNLSGGTTWMLDYVYPEAGNPYVIAFHAVIVIMSLLGLYWVLALGGFEVLSRYSYVFFGREQVNAYMRVHLVVALVGALLAVILMWGGVFPDVRSELGALPN